MSQLLNGVLNLSRIPKHLIQTNAKGEKVLYIDVAERQTPGQYGDTHYISVYDKGTRQKVYIGDLKPKELPATQATQGGYAPQPAAPAPQYQPNTQYAPRPVAPAPSPLTPQDSDLPF